MSEITENVNSLLKSIDSSITLVAATKMNDATRVQEAIRAGVKVCGENRVQEMLEKHSLGAYKGSELHFIGHLQKNKVSKVVGLCSLIQSVDSIELLEAINRQAHKLGIVQNVLIEINIGDESSKSGIDKDDLLSVLEAASHLKSIQVLGLMAIPPKCSESSQTRRYFEDMHNIFVDIDTEKYDNISMAFLSMGMSSDYAEAVDCGSNMIRVGSGIFGPRNYNLPEV